MSDLVPEIGLGTSRNEDPEECAESVRTALDVGYRHVDTAESYGNEAYVGNGIARADIDREEVFLATKVFQENLAYDDVFESVEASLDRLGVDHVDLLYVHWPVDAYDPGATLPAFDELHDVGVAKNVGVSNFTPERIEEARAVLDAPIVAIQVEMHPLLPPSEELTTYCRDHGIELVAYSPLCRGEALDLPEVEAVADEHGVSLARVILAWLLEKDVRVIPKAVGPDHVRDNFGATNLELDDEDVARIDSIERRKRKFDRDDAPWHG